MFSIKHCFRWENFLHVCSLFCTAIQFTTLNLRWWVMMTMTMLKSSKDKDDDYFVTSTVSEETAGPVVPCHLLTQGETGGQGGHYYLSFTTLAHSQCHSVIVSQFYKLKPQINCCLLSGTWFNNPSIDSYRLSSVRWIEIWNIIKTEKMSP